MKRASKVARWLAGMALLIASGSCSKSTPTQVTPTGAEQIGARAPVYGMEPSGGSGDQAIVVLAGNVDVEKFLDTHHLVQITTLDIQGTTFRLLEFPHGVGPDFLQQLNKVDGVKSAQHNSPIDYPEGGGENMSFDDWDTRADGVYTNQEPIRTINLDRVLDRFPDAGTGVLVAVLDTGGDDTHPAFDRTLEAWPMGFVGNGLTWSNSRETQNKVDEDDDGHVDEAAGHGTHVAGIVHLVAPKARILAIKVLNDDGWGTVFGLAQGLVYATELRVNVVNMSLGLEGSSAIVEAAVDAAAASGVQLVASAGNQGGSVPQYPASYKEKVLSVAGVEKDDHVWKSSNRNPDVDLTAPCVDIVSPIPHLLGLKTDYAVASGTSMAAPFVTGAVAIVMSLRGCSPTQAGVLVAENSISIDDINPHDAGLIGRGRIDCWLGPESEMFPN
jgi:subtilisin family serine protease